MQNAFRSVITHHYQLLNYVRKKAAADEMDFALLYIIKIKLVHLIYLYLCT